VNAASGIILFAHGSRDPAWSKPMLAIAELIRQKQPGVQVQCAYLEMMAPSLSDCATGLVALGASSIRVMPLFLGVGKHVREDLPALIETLRKNHPAVRFELLPTVGEDERVLRVMADIALGQA
jgi:sirohydrochlorin cobaltochelatase